MKWAYVKATEGTYYTNPYFAQQYNGSYDVGMIRGAYHFATPDTTSGAAQANYFVDHGGGWSADGRTLPGVLDIEWNPYGDACYGKTASRDGHLDPRLPDTYKAAHRPRRRDLHGHQLVDAVHRQLRGLRRGQPAVDRPVRRRRRATLPAGWGFYTMWQYTSSGPTVGDHDRFNGALDRVQALANG